METLRPEQMNHALNKIVTFTKWVNRGVETPLDKPTRLDMLGKLCYQYYCSSSDRNRFPILRASHGLLAEAHSTMERQCIRYAENSYYLGLINLRVSEDYRIPYALDKAEAFFREVEQHPLYDSLNGNAKETLFPQFRAVESQVNRLNLIFNQDTETDETEVPELFYVDEISGGELLTEHSGTADYYERDGWRLYPRFFAYNPDFDISDLYSDELGDPDIPSLVDHMLPDDHLYRYLTPKSVNSHELLKWLEGYQKVINKRKAPKRTLSKPFWVSPCKDKWYITDRNLKNGRFVFKEVSF